MEKSGPSDPELLSEWLETRREEAFHTLVTRYAGLVLMTARRTCGDDAMAAEASQLTFILLARKARSLTTCASFGGWLHRAALLHAKNLMRGARREVRKRRQLFAAMTTPLPPDSGDPWQDLEPLLDEALATLPDKYREALLLRFYRSLGVREIGETLGISTDAAQKRVDRATQRLRDKLARLGCPVAGTSLAALLLAGFTADVQAAAPAAAMLATKTLAAGTVASGGMSAGTSSFITALSMKTTSYAAPVIVLLGSGVWLVSQRLAMARLEEENALLATRLTAVSTPAAAATRRNTKTALDKRPIDWKEVIDQLNPTGGISRAPYLASPGLLRLGKALSAMSREELAAALEDIDHAGLDPIQRQSLKGRLQGLLANHDAEDALNRIVASSDEPAAQSHLLGAYARTDLKKAEAWLDRQIAEGKLDDKSLDGGNYRRLVFERELIYRLIAADPDAAARRMAALPESQRLAMLQVRGAKVAEEAQASFARLLREQLPEKDRLSVLTWALTEKGETGTTSYAEADAYLQRIDASAMERDACILALAKRGRFPRASGDFFKVGSEDLDALRAWVGKVAPPLVEQATANAVQSLLFNFNYQDAAAIALQCHETGASDETLIPLLESHYVQDNGDLARSIAGRLRDPQRREDYLKKLEGGSGQ